MRFPLKFTLTVGLTFLLVGCAQSPQSRGSNTRTNLEPSVASTGKKIQLGDFPVTTASTSARPSPSGTLRPRPSGPACPVHVRLPYPLTCSCGIYGQTPGDAWFGLVHPGGIYRDIDLASGLPVKYDWYDPASSRQQSLIDTGTAYVACIGAPVIYLYPTVPTEVSVTIETPGTIYISEPTYPTNGWQNVLAQPNGKLTYQEKEFPYLYYETAVESTFTPQQGFIIEKAKLEPMLLLLTAQLGLIPKEQNDFLAYWLPRLNQLDSRYILFSVVDKQEKNRVDNVIVTPEPNTRIEFLVYYKPLAQRVAIAPLVLPPAPKRTGFTMVEWGGFIDQRK